MQISHVWSIGYRPNRHLDISVPWHWTQLGRNFPFSFTHRLYQPIGVFFMQDRVDVNVHVLLPTNHLIVSKCHLWKAIIQTFIKKCARDYWKGDIFGLSDLRTIGPSDYRPFGLSDLRTIGPSPFTHKLACWSAFIRSYSRQTLTIKRFTLSNGEWNM